MKQLAILEARRIVDDTNQYDEIVYIYVQVDVYNTKISERLVLWTKMHIIKGLDTSTESETCVPSSNDIGIWILFEA